jgi:hypothetical protein
MILLLALSVLLFTTCAAAQPEVIELPLAASPVRLYPCAGYCQLADDDPEAALTTGLCQYG